MVIVVDVEGAGRDQGVGVQEGVPGRREGERLGLAEMRRGGHGSDDMLMEERLECRLRMRREYQFSPEMQIWRDMTDQTACSPPCWTALRPSASKASLVLVDSPLELRPL